MLGRWACHGLAFALALGLGRAQEASRGGGDGRTQEGQRQAAS